MIRLDEGGSALSPRPWPAVMRRAPSHRRRAPIPRRRSPRAAPACTRRRRRSEDRGTARPAIPAHTREPQRIAEQQRPLGADGPRGQRRHDERGEHQKHADELHRRRDRDREKRIEEHAPPREIDERGDGEHAGIEHRPGTSWPGTTQRIWPTSRSFRFSAPCGLKLNSTISALAAMTKTTPMTASCKAARRRSVQIRKPALSSAAATALAWTDQPSGSQPKKSAVTTPKPATWAIARSMKTMPRSSTSLPSGTWVDRTRRPVKKAGQMSPDHDRPLGRPQPGQQPLHRVLVEARNVLGVRRAADREGQQHRRQMALLGDETATVSGPRSRHR